MPPIFKEDQTSKMKFITAFFDDFDKKAAYLGELYKSGHRDEARILCSCYIDSLASLAQRGQPLTSDIYTARGIQLCELMGKVTSGALIVFVNG
jgi:hypothetical protein